MGEFLLIGRPAVSLVTICLNDLEGLRTTYESVRRQTEPPEQWVVIDGGSDDGTVEWLGTINWAPMTWLSEADRGIYDAMNKGLAQTSGNYVLFLNSGDVLSTPDVLGTVVEALASSSARPTLLYGDCFEVDPAGRSHLRRSRPPFWVPLGMPTTHQAMYFRVDALMCGFEASYRLSGDYAAVCRLYMMSRGRDFLRVPKPLCHFKLGGRSDQQRSLLLEENFDIRKRILGMSALGSRVLHVLHFLHGLVKQHIPALHRLVRYG